jgi:hypothetical protein
VSRITVTLKGNGLRLREFQYWWIKAVTGFDPAFHCTRCLIGRYLNHGGSRTMPRMNVAETYELEPGVRAIYFCGVSMPGYKYNFHAPLVSEPGHTVELPMYGNQRFLATDARALLPITPLPAGFEGLPYVHWRCRNFQFGVQQFGYRRPR